MRGAAKLATGVAARCPAGITKCLPWLLLTAALYGEWAWADLACEMFRPAPGIAVGWQIVHGVLFALWCLVNFFGMIFGCILVHVREFRGKPLPAWWGSMWRPGRDVRLRELVLWIALAPSVAFATLAEALARAGSVRIRRGR